MLDWRYANECRQHQRASSTGRSLRTMSAGDVRALLRRSQFS
jgi:hypothetical protein